jgi:tetratricopeptide (TPR) repeat protein
LRIGELQKAHKALDSALKLAPIAFAPLLNRGIVLVMLNRDKDAEPDLRAAVTQNDESAVAHFFLGRTLARLRRFPEAETNLVPGEHKFPIQLLLWHRRHDHCKWHPDNDGLPSRRRRPKTTPEAAAKDADQSRRLFCN